MYQSEQRLLSNEHRIVEMTKASILSLREPETGLQDEPMNLQIGKAVRMTMGSCEAGECDSPAGEQTGVPLMYNARAIEPKLMTVIRHCATWGQLKD